MLANKSQGAEQSFFQRIETTRDVGFYHDAFTYGKSRGLWATITDNKKLFNKSMKMRQRSRGEGIMKITSSNASQFGKQPKHIKGKRLLVKNNGSHNKSSPVEMRKDEKGLVNRANQTK